jgi:exonuclease III
MVNILNWKCRGLNQSKKRLLLCDILKDNRIEIVGIQETKMKEISDSILNKLGPFDMDWIVQKSKENSRRNFLRF